MLNMSKDLKENNFSHICFLFSVGGILWISHHIKDFDSHKIITKNINDQPL